MRSTRHLMSIEQAAGFAMAPSEDEMAESALPPEEALRHGHVEATLKAKLDDTSSLVGDNARGVWDLFSGWLGGRAHA